MPVPIYTDAEKAAEKAYAEYTRDHDAEADPYFGRCVVCGRLYGCDCADDEADEVPAGCVATEQDGVFVATDAAMKGEDE